MEASIAVGHQRSTSIVHRVLVVNDASAAASNAVAVADLIAARCNAQLTVANLSTMLQPLHAYRTPRTDRETKRLAGDFVDTVTRASARCDVVVVGALGATEVERRARSQTALQIVAGSASSVWIDRQPAVLHGKLGQPRRILVGVSDSESSSRALAMADELARSFDAELTIAHVIPLVAMTLVDTAATRGDDYTSSLVVSALAKLRSLASNLPAHGRRNVIVPLGEAADTLVALSAGFDLVVIGSGRSLERSALHIGGVASRLAIDAEASVVIAR